MYSREGRLNCVFCGIFQKKVAFNEKDYPVIEACRNGVVNCCAAAHFAGDMRRQIWLNITPAACHFAVRASRLVIENRAVVAGKPLFIVE